MSVGLLALSTRYPNSIEKLYTTGTPSSTTTGISGSLAMATISGNTNTITGKAPVMTRIAPY